MMPSFLVHTEAGLMVHRADVTPLMASDREIAGEPKGFMPIVCAWTGTPMGWKPCISKNHGEISHSMSPAAAAAWRAELSKGVSK